MRNFLEVDIQAKGDSCALGFDVGIVVEVGHAVIVDAMYAHFAEEQASPIGEPPAVALGNIAFLVEIVGGEAVFGPRIGDTEDVGLIVHPVEDGVVERGSPEDGEADFASEVEGVVEEEGNINIDLGGGTLDTGHIHDAECVFGKDVFAINAHEETEVVVEVDIETETGIESWRSGGRAGCIHKMVDAGNLVLKGTQVEVDLSLGTAQSQHSNNSKCEYFLHCRFQFYAYLTEGMAIYCRRTVFLALFNIGVWIVECKM